MPFILKKNAGGEAVNAESITDDRLHIPSDIDEAYRISRQ